MHLILRVSKIVRLNQSVSVHLDTHATEIYCVFVLNNFDLIWMHDDFLFCSVQLSSVDFSSSSSSDEHCIHCISMHAGDIDLILDTDIVCFMYRSCVLFMFHYSLPIHRWLSVKNKMVKKSNKSKSKCQNGSIAHFHVCCARHANWIEWKMKPSKHCALPWAKWNRAWIGLHL